MDSSNSRIWLSGVGGDEDSWQQRQEGGWETLISLVEVTTEASAAYWGRSVVQCKMHFPRCCFMSKEGGHKCLFESWSGIETIYWFAALWRDDCIAKTSEIEHRWQPQRGFFLGGGGLFSHGRAENALFCKLNVWLKHTDNKHMFLIFKIHSWHAHWTNAYYRLHTCMHLWMYSCSLFVYAWLLFNTISHSSFASPYWY